MPQKIFSNFLIFYYIGSYGFTCRLRSEMEQKWEKNGLRMKIEEFKRFVSWLPEAVDKIFFGEYLDGVLLIGKTNVKEPEARCGAQI